MTVNDVNHELEVENQLGHLDALMERATQPGLRGVPLIQPISLGSDGVAPFAAPDGGVITGIPNQPHPTVKLGLFGTNYFIPGLGPTPPISGCSVTYTQTPTGVSVQCTHQKVVTFNYLNNSTKYSFKFSGEGNASVTLGYETNGSLIVVNTPGRGGGFEDVTLIGSNNRMWVTGTGGSNQKIVIYGNNNQLHLNATSQQLVTANVTGNRNSIFVKNTPGTSSVVYAEAMGEYTNFTAGRGGYYNVTYTGFNFMTHLSPFCPYDNVANRNHVTPIPTEYAKYVTANVTYNDTELSGFTTRENTTTHWHYAYLYKPTTCYGFAHFTARVLAGLEAASLVVHLENRYAPAAEVAMDQGAVIYAQPGGIPFMVDPPPLTYSPGYVAIWLPAFYNGFGPESGTGTTALSISQLVSQSYTFPGGGWVVNPGQKLVLTYHTPYYVAWMNFLCGASSPFGQFAKLTLDNVSGAWPGPWGCDQATTPWNFTQIYEPSGPMGSITISLPVSQDTVVSIRLGVFAFADEPS